MATVFGHNGYKRVVAGGQKHCIVLPPVGSARSAILLLECIERFTKTKIFDNPGIKIQVCNAGRLDAHRAALLAIGFYLGSDNLLDFNLTDLQTTFSEAERYERGKRLVLYDAEGNFERDFDWWNGPANDPFRYILHSLPFEQGRTDLLVASSKLDIENINLLATLLTHAAFPSHAGCWRKLGQAFQTEMVDLLDRYMLSGLLDAPWIYTDDKKAADDERFAVALQELVKYAHEEVERLNNEDKRGATGILEEMQIILLHYRFEVARQCELLKKGGIST